MKNCKIIALILALLLAVPVFGSCAGSSAPDYEDDGKNVGGIDVFAANVGGSEPVQTGRSDQSGILVENPFTEVEQEAVSTFSSDVDAASYTLFRKMVNAGYDFEELKDTSGKYLRTEELINYFDYDAPDPDGKLFGIKATLGRTPYNAETYLLKLTLKTADVQPSVQNNLVFLIDVSGSMASFDKLPLLKKAFSYLTGRLGNEDVVSIVTYSGKEEIVLDGCAGSKKETILQAVDSLKASGSTNGEAGLKMAYQLAEKHFIPGGNNRIFLASDGDLNVGISSAEELKAFVEGKRSSGVFLSVFGFGSGNYKDANMEALADNGNGVYNYIDGETEAEKVFSVDLFKVMYTAAKDVKLQLTFDAQSVDAYRLIGYENRLLSKEDFKNDRKDAGDLGAGSAVTVLYELKLKENAEKIADLAVRYKQPDGEKSEEETVSVGFDCFAQRPDDDFLFAAAVAELSLLLRDSAYKGTATVEHLRALLSDVAVGDDIYKAQFKELVDKLLKE